MNPVKLRALALCCLVGSCTTNPPASNRYDPQGTGNLAPGRITGTVYVAGADSQTGWLVHVTDAALAEVAQGLATVAHGVFTSPELPPGTYRIDVDVPVGSVPIRVDDVEVLPGRTTDVGLLTSSEAPPVGDISGLVVLADSSAPPGGVTVAATRLTGTTTETRVTATDATGAYSFAALPAGTYEVRGDRAGFTPDLVTVSLPGPAAAASVRAVSGCTGSSCQAEPLRLFPASAVLRFSVPTQAGAVLGAPFSSTRSVDLVMLAFGGVNQMRFSESPTLTEGDTDVAWRDYVAEVPVTLSAGEGAKTMYAQFRVVSPDGRERLRTETYQTTIVYDATPPAVLSYVVAPSAVEHAGVRYLVGDPSSVPVQLTALDPYSRVSGVKLVVEGADPGAVPFAVVDATGASVTYSAVVSLSTTYGTKDVTLYLRDGAGNTSAPLTGTVMYDRTTPSIHSVQLAGGAAWTSSAVVTLTVDADDQGDPAGIAGMYVSSSPTFGDASLLPFVNPASLLWTLDGSTGDGLKTVYVKVVDWAGNSWSSQDQLGLDRTPPSLAASLVGTAADGSSTTLTRDAAVTVSVIATDALTPGTALEMQVSSRADFEGATWAALASATPFTLPSPTADGLKTVYVRVRDLAGNQAVTSATTILDVTPPTLSAVSLSSGNSTTYSRTTSATLQLASAGADQMRITGDITDSFAGQWQPVTGAVAVTLSAGDALKSVTVAVRDIAGNTPSPATLTATTTLDTAPPAGTLGINAGAAFTTTRDVTLTITPAADAVGMAVADGASLDCTSTVYGPVQASRAWLLPFGDGTPAVTVCFIDRAGNTASATDTIVLDTTPPAAPGLTRSMLTDRFVGVTWSTPVDPDLAGFALERRLDTEGSFTVITASLGAGVTSYTDLIAPATLGHERFYRLRAYDTHGLNSAYSIELGAGVPIGRAAVTYMNPYDAPDRALAWSKPAGTVLLLGTYRYEDPSGFVVENALPTNSTFARLVSGRERYNEQLVVLGQNADATLTWNATFAFGSQRQSIATTGYNWFNTRIALGPDGTPHVMWGSDVAGSAFYYRKLDGVSATVVVDSGGSVPRYCDLAVDSNGVPHLVWLRGTGVQGLYYQKLDGVSAAQLIGPSTFGSSSIAVDASNTAHVVAAEYINSTDFNLAYIKVNGTNTIERPDTAGDVGRNPSIAIDKNGVPHIAYRDNTNGDLKYLKKDGSAARTLDSTGDVGYSSSIDIDPKTEVPVITYSDSTNQALKLVRAVAVPAPVELAKPANPESAVAVDDAGVAHVVFSSYVGGVTSLKYVRVDGTDTPRLVDVRGTPGYQVGMKVDALGRAHIFHLNSGTHEVDYVVLESGGLLDLIGGPAVPGVDPSWQYADIAVDAGRVPTLVYTESTRLHTVKVAHRRTDAVVDTSAASFADPSIEIDASGKAIVAYHDAGPGDLKYYRSGSTPTTLDSTGNVGSSTSLALGPGGAAYVTYHDNTNSALKFVRADVGPPAPQTLDGPTGNPGRVSYLTMSPSGVPQVVYNRQNGIYNDMVYRPIDGVTAPIVSMTGSYFVAMAIDGNGLPNIVSGNTAGNGLQYVLDPPRNPVTLLDQSVSGTGGFFDMRVDPQGVPHVIYDAPDGTNVLGYLRLDGISRPQRLYDTATVAAFIGTYSAVNGLGLAIDSSGATHVGMNLFDGNDAGFVLFARGQYNRALLPTQVNSTRVPSGCRDVELFGPDMVGCAGTFTYAQRTAVCADAGLTVCSAQTWVDRRRGLTPAYNYWTDDNLRYGGTGTGSCFASTSLGTVCSSPMRVCSGTSDRLANACNWVNCGLDANAPNQYFGGCAGNTTAGVLCCTP